MTYKLFLALFAFLMITSSLPQSRFNAGASFNIGFPSGSFSDVAKTGVGGSLTGEYVFNKQISATLSASYQNFPGKYEGIAVQGKVLDFSFNSIPLMAGMRYYFLPEFYGSMEAGVNFFRVSVDISDLYNDDKYSTDYEAKYTGCIGIGYRYKLAEASAFELAGSYQLVQDDFNFFAIRLGLLILLDKI